MSYLKMQFRPCVRGTTRGRYDRNEKEEKLQHSQEMHAWISNRFNEGVSNYYDFTLLMTRWLDGRGSA